jgi:predicted nucleic acid-binding protein
VYLDCCCFNRPFDDQTQLRVRLEAEAKLAIQDEIRTGSFELAWSYIMDFENEANPFEERKAAISSWKHRAAINVSETPEILALALDLNARGLPKKDALHVSCAVESGALIFFTTDDRVLRKRSRVPEIAIHNPLDYAAGTAKPRP